MKRFLASAIAACAVACGAPVQTPDQVPVDPPELRPVPDVTPEIPAPPEPETAAAEPPVWVFLRGRYDADRDGRIAPEEYRRGAESYRRLDADGDGLVTITDFDPKWTGMPRTADFRYGEGGPETGDEAPDFRLQSTDGSVIQLSEFRGEKPVVLVFGSFT